MGICEVSARYFPMAQEFNSDPETWELTDKFGDRSLRIWIEILAIMDREKNRWRLVSGWDSVIGRKVRQSSATVRRVVTWMLGAGWLEVSQWSANPPPDLGQWLGKCLLTTGEPLASYPPEVLRARNYGKFRRIAGGAQHAPTPTPTPTPKIKDPASPGSQKKEVRESEPNPDIKQELIKRAAALFEDERNRQKMAIFVLNMTDGRAADQMLRAVPVIERCIAALRLALMKGTKIDDPLGWMTRVYARERTKYIQEVEHPRNKAPVPTEIIGAIFDRIGKGRA